VAATEAAAVVAVVITAEMTINPHWKYKQCPGLPVRTFLFKRP
jgi:hypothetical protein